MISSPSLKSVRVRTNFLFGLGSHLACNGLLVLGVYYLVMQISAQEARELLGWIVPMAQACCFFAAVALSFGLATRDSKDSGNKRQTVRGWMIRRILPFGAAARRAIQPAVKLGRSVSLADVEAALALVRAIDWKVYKGMAIAYYHELGFRVLEQPRRSEGVDFLLYNHTGYTVVGVRCVPRAANPVSLKQVRAFHRAVRLAGAGRGVMMTAGEFDREALEFGAENDLELLAGETFVRRVLSLPPHSFKRLLGETPELNKISDRF